MAEYTLPKQYQDKYDLLWINLKAKEFDSQTGYARGNSSIKTGKELSSWSFLAPNEIQENVAHDWGEYESVGSRMAQKMGEVKKSIGEFKGLTENLFNISLEGDGNVMKRASGLMNSLAGAAAGVDIPKFKLDTSMVYQNTKRREYTFTFHLTGLWNDVYMPVRELEKLSCPELGEGMIDIKFPAIFRVWSSPLDFIKINHAALTSVQPTWKGPFMGGIPSNCELQITVMDIEPLYRSSFVKGGIISTTEDAEVNTYGGR